MFQCRLASLLVEEKNKVHRLAFPASSCVICFEYAPSLDLCYYFFQSPHPSVVWVPDALSSIGPLCGLVSCRRHKLWYCFSFWRLLLMMLRRPGTSGPHSGRLWRWLPNQEYQVRGWIMWRRHIVRVPIFPIVVCVRSAYVIGTGVGFRVESGAVVLLQLDLWGYPLH